MPDDNAQNPERLTPPPELELAREVGQTDQLTDSEMSRIVQRLGSLSLSEDTILAEHQIEAFEDVITFFRNGGRECYVEIPTGGGKTVLYVEIAKRLAEIEAIFGEQSRILVTVPTVDLAGQAVGSVDPKTGKKRGFKGFAPELDVRPLHGKIPIKEREKNIAEADVLVTTYNSFRNIVSSLELAESKTPEEWDTEIQKSIEARRDAENEEGTLHLVRSNFIKEAYAAQEVRDARVEVKIILAQHERGDIQLTKKEIETYEKVLDISTVEDGEQADNITALKKIRPRIISMSTPRIKGAMKALQDVRRIANQKAKDTRERKNNKELSPSTEVVYDIVEESEKIYKQLNHSERFIMQTMMRKSNIRLVTVNDLRSYKDTQIASDYMDKIRYLRGRAKYHEHQVTRFKYMKTLRQTAGTFDLIICDEAHRSIGTETWDAIRAYAARRDIALLGLTATDKYYDRSLEDFFEKKVHELTKQEAMRRKIVNPVAMFVHDTGLRFSNVGLDASGEYDRATIREMRFNDERNMIGVNYAAQLTEAGYGGIMSAIAGDEGDHARVLAGMLNQREITDPKTGERRLMRAACVLDDTPDRQDLYDLFEAGEIDWLTFVDVIREGWDSDRAKALINMRPTRSPLLAIQRLGRIGRIYPGAPISILIDLFDGIERLSDEEIAIKEIPPVLGVDVFEVDAVLQGHIVGPKPETIPSILSVLGKSMPERTMTAHHNNYTDLLQSLWTIDGRGVAQSSRVEHASLLNWQTWEAVQKGYRGFLPKEVILEAVAAEPPLVHATRGRRGDRVVPLFNSLDIRKLVDNEANPEVNPWKLHVDQDGVRWITPEGCTQMLSKRLPHLSPTQITDAVRQYEEAYDYKFKKSLGRVQLSFGGSSRYGLTQMYQLEEVVEKLVPYLEAID